MKPPFLADQNIDPDLLLGLIRVSAEIDVVRVQEAEPSQLPAARVIGGKHGWGALLQPVDVRAPRFAP